MKTTLLMILLCAAVAGAGEPSSGSNSRPEIVTPARFLADTADDRIAELKRRLSIAGRERGPFGLYQNPGKAPVISRSSREIPKTSFRDFIKDIRISLINSREREFLVGARLFRLGQVFPIVRGGEKISVRVEAVDPSRVTFKNLQSGEVAVSRLDTLPDGVSAAGQPLRLQGITLRKKSEVEPLRIESNSPPPLP
tara:strand:- start:5682 stop:6269 length:588 start_codon:yes stop_codon:yes gene_type:complete